MKPYVSVALAKALDRFYLAVVGLLTELDANDRSNCDPTTSRATDLVKPALNFIVNLVSGLFITWGEAEGRVSENKSDEEETED